MTDAPAGAVLNQTGISGLVLEKTAMRYTPSGVPVVEARLAHESEQIEAQLPRKVNCEIPLLALGDPAVWLNAAPLGVSVKISGFLAAKSRHVKMPVLHVQTIEFLEGNNHE